MPFVQRSAMPSTSKSHADDIRKAHIKKIPDKILEKGDPDFVDERVHKEEKQKEEKSFLESLFGEE